MHIKYAFTKIFSVVTAQFLVVIVLAQPGVPSTKWAAAGNSFFQVEKGEIVKTELPSQNKITIISKKQLTTKDGKNISPSNFLLSADGNKALIYTNTKRVWRFQTRGDYWMLNIKTGELKQLGKGRPESSLQFAK